MLCKHGINTSYSCGECVAERLAIDIPIKQGAETRLLIIQQHEETRILIIQHTDKVLTAIKELKASIMDKN